MGEYVRMRDSGDGSRCVDTSNVGKVQVKTANYTVKQYEGEGFIFSNLGAAGAVTFTLPPAKAGERLIFVRETPAQNIVLTASSGAIRGGVTPFTGTNATASTASQYASIELLGMGTNWHIVRAEGTWTLS